MKPILWHVICVHGLRKYWNNDVFTLLVVYTLQPMLNLPEDVHQLALCNPHGTFYETDSDTLKLFLKTFPFSLY